MLDMIYAARLVWNIDNWEFPSGLTQHGVRVNYNNGKYYYGLEEWLNNKKLRDLKLGYLDCYRITKRQDKVDIMLYTVNPLDNKYYHIGSIKAVSQIDENPNTISSIKNQLAEKDWLTKKIKEDFNRIEKTPKGVDSNGLLSYQNNNWNSKIFVSNPPGGFILNIRYENITFFEKHKWVDLSIKDPEISVRWRHIRHRYALLNPHFNNDLIQYFESIKI